jgi:hypothetical protein
MGLFLNFIEYMLDFFSRQSPGSKELTGRTAESVNASHDLLISHPRGSKVLFESRFLPAWRPGAAVQRDKSNIRHSTPACLVARVMVSSERLPPTLPPLRPVSRMAWRKMARVFRVHEGILTGFRSDGNRP